METRKKYKIALSEKYVRKSENGNEWFQFPINVSGQLVAIQTIIPLDPYTEPDLEKVRKEAFEEGKKQAKVQAELDVCHDIEKVAKANYQQGLNDAWDAVRKIYSFDLEEREELFHDSERFNIGSICEAYSASEAIEKIRQYEQEKEEQIQVGDEVYVEKLQGKAVVMQTGKIMCCAFQNGDTFTPHMKDCKKTGRHFPEIARVLAKMKETDNG